MHSLPSLRRAVAAVCLLFVSAAQAQTTPRARDPLDAKAAVPPVTHRSSLAAYRAGGDTPAVPWRQANDTVTRIGGWRAYAREAAAADAPASAPAAEQPASSAAAEVPASAPAAAAPASAAAASASAPAPVVPAQAPARPADHGHHGAQRGTAR